MNNYYFKDNFIYLWVFAMINDTSLLYRNDVPSHHYDVRSIEGAKPSTWSNKHVLIVLFSIVKYNKLYLKEIKYNSTNYDTINFHAANAHSLCTQLCL